MKVAELNTVTSDGKACTVAIYGHGEIVRPDGSRIIYSRTATGAINVLEGTLSPSEIGRIERLERALLTTLLSERIGPSSTPKRTKKKCTSTTKKNSKGLRNSGKKGRRGT